MSREASAGPEASWRMPCAVESLTVRIAAVSRSAVEEDIFLVSFLLSASRPLPVAAGFVQNTKPFHHQALRGARDGLLRTSTLEINLEIALFPSKYFVNSLIALDGAVRCMADLPVHDVNVAAVARVGQRQEAALAAHFQRLHQVNHVHLRQIAAQATLRRGLARHFFQRDLVDHALDALHRLAQVKRLLDEFIYLPFQIEALGDIRFGGQENDGNVHGSPAGAQFFTY